MCKRLQVQLSELEAAEPEIRRLPPAEIELENKFWHFNFKLRLCQCGA
jgi:hypothetical protein